MNEQSLAKLIRANKKLIEKPVMDNMLYATITSVSPIEIKLQSGLVIDAGHIYLGEALRPHKVTIPHTHEYNGSTERTIGLVGYSGTPIDHSHDIKKQTTEDVHKENTEYEKYVTLEMYPKLAKGDIVLVFAFNNFQKFYIAERIKEAQ